MSTLSELPPELLRLTALHLRTVDCSNLSLTCWTIYNSVAPVLFERIRIFDEFSGDISNLFDECPFVKSATRHVTLYQWDSDFIAATLSADTIYHGIATFLNLTSLRLLLNNAPHLCWMQQLHRLFLILRNHRINKLELELTDFIDAGRGHLSSPWQNPPYPFYCLRNLDHLSITILLNDRLGGPLQPWLIYFQALILASKDTLTTLVLDICIPSHPAFRFPLNRDPLFKVLKEMKQLETLALKSIYEDLDHIRETLSIAQPDICPKLRRVVWEQNIVQTVATDIIREPNFVIRASPIPWMPQERARLGPSTVFTHLMFGLLDDSDPEDYDYEPSSSPSSSSSSDYDESDSDVVESMTGTV